MVVLDGYIFFIENSLLSKDDILSAISSEKGYQYLLEFDYLKQNHKGFSFHFVGIISVNDKVICVLPKYYSNVDLNPNDIFPQFAKIIKVLKKAGATEPSIPDYNNISTNDYDDLSEIVLADKLIKDYIEYGLIIKSKNLSGFNTEGEVNWSDTIGTIQPIFSKKRPIYIDTYNLSVITEDYNVITELHKWIVKTSLTKFGRILDYNFTFHEECTNKLSDLGTLEYLNGILRKELNDRYIDRDILLIKRMLSFISNEGRPSNDQFTLYGTGYFHTIWEKCCGTFFNNKIDQFKQFIPAPKWLDNQGNAIDKESLLPDIVTYTTDNSALLILDAKYYNLKYTLNPFNVFNNPGVSDVSKQFLYYKIFEKIPYVNKLNCFIYPSLQEDAFNVLGFVTFSLFKDLKIFNIYLSSILVYESYLNNSSTDERFLDDLALSLAKEYA